MLRTSSRRSATPPCVRRRAQQKASPRCFSVAVQPAHFEMPDARRTHPDEAYSTTHFTRLWKNHPGAMFDPTLPPQHEIFQVENFWKELQALIADWEEAVSVIDEMRGEGDAAPALSDKEKEHRLLTAHLRGDKVFKFFTHMRAHLDRNPRDRIGFYQTRPAGMEDVYGIFLKILARQIDTDYCPRCHLRCDGSTTVCGDPTIVSAFHYGDNPTFGFQGAETEHSFWTPSWFVEYEGRAKELWYQALQLPFFRVAKHTAMQCEGLMEVYRATLNRGEANHFMRQCQVHGLPITARMAECHQEILDSTNARSLFFHGDPSAVSPRWLRHQVELEKLEEFKEKDGLIKYPPASYLPHKEGVEELPESFTVNEDGWVSDFLDVTKAIDASVNDWSPIKAHRSQSAEFPDWAYSEQSLAEIDHWRTQILRSETTVKPDNLRIRRKVVQSSRSRVAGFLDAREEPEEQAGSFVFPTATGYDVFDTTDQAFAPLHHWPSSGDADLFKFAIKSGCRVRATTLTQYLTPHAPAFSHRFPIRTKEHEALPAEKLPVVDFGTNPRVMLEILEYGSKAQDGESMDAWRRGGRPWCHGKWEDLETGGRNKNLRVGAKFSSQKGGGGTLTLVGAYDGQLWAAKANERYASVPLGSKHEELQAFRPEGGVDAWSVQEQVVAEGVVVGVKDDQVWVQWGPNAVATPIGANMEEICKHFRNLEVLPGTHSPTEPPSWHIPFRNDWREEKLKEVLRKPWNDQPFTAPENRVMPLDKQALSDPKTYRLDDFRTKEYEGRIDTRNAMGGSTRLAGGSRYVDDVVFSVNPMGNNSALTGFGQPQVDSDELRVPIGVDDGSNDKVEQWEIDEMEQCLRDIGGRAPGASSPRVDTLAPEAAQNDPVEVRRHSKLQISKRLTTVVDRRNPANTDLKQLNAGLLAMRLKMKKTAPHEYGGYKDAGHLEILPHERRSILGEDSRQAPHTRLHLTGKEAEFMSVPRGNESAVKAFAQMADYYAEMSEPFDVGHETNPTFKHTDALVPNIGRPSKTMSVGKKRRMASLLLRLFMKKLEKQMMTLSEFAFDNQLNRVALLSWFGGDSPASPSILKALKKYLHTELEELDLLDELQLDAVDTYSPVYEPGFYKWLDKSRVEQQHELLLSAKLYRFEGSNIFLRDALSEPHATSDGKLDVSQLAEVEKYEDRLMGGNASPFSLTSLNDYDDRTKAKLPRVSVSPHTNVAGANIADVQTNVGFDKDHLPRSIRLTGALSLKDLKTAVRTTMLQKYKDQGKSGYFGAQERERLAELSVDGPLDARAALEFAKEWNEGMAMDLQYATRRNKGNPALRARFENFMGLQEAAKTVETKLDGLYEHAEGAFRIRQTDSGYSVENATFNAEQWEGPLEETDRPGVFKAAVRAGDNQGTLTVMRLGNDTVEWTYSHSSAEGVVVPTLAKAKRADLDLEGTMWNLYATGNWAPGEDEAKKLVFEWTRKNTDKVLWTLATKDLKTADTAIIRAALSEGIEVEEDAPYVADDGSIRRKIRASGENAQSWVASIPYPGISSDLLQAVKLDAKTGAFSFECTQIAEDVQRVTDVAALPFEFDSFRAEVARTEARWWRLGMQLSDVSVPVVQRSGTPHYAELVELLHWLDELLIKVEEGISDVLSRTSTNKQEEIRTEMEKFKTIERECAKEVVDYQAQNSPSVSPILLGATGYNATVADNTGKSKVLYDTSFVSGFNAKVLERELPLLRWWHNALSAVQTDRKNHHTRLSEACKVNRVRTA